MSWREGDELYFCYFVVLLPVLALVHDWERGKAVTHPFMATRQASWLAMAYFVGGAAGMSDEMRAGMLACIMPFVFSVFLAFYTGLALGSKDCEAYSSSSMLAHVLLQIALVCEDAMYWPQSKGTAAWAFWVSMVPFFATACGQVFVYRRRNGTSVYGKYYFGAFQTVFIVYTVLACGATAGLRTLLDAPPPTTVLVACMFMLMVVARVVRILLVGYDEAFEIRPRLQ